MSLGLMITFGVYQGRQQSTIKQNLSSNQAITEVESTDSATLAEIESVELLINSPEPNFLTNEAELMVAGRSTPNNFIVIFVNDQEYITTADEAGDFSTKVELEEGGNLLLVTSIDEDGKQVEKQLSVIFEE
jgi:hypothetical protein